MRLPRSKAIWGGAVLILAPGLYLAPRLFRPHIKDRVYTIGWQNSPPFQQKAEDGSPAGLAIDLVRDAARRRGIRLQWVWCPGSSEAALRSRQVDLWPLITITPARQKVIHISKPYLQHHYTFTVLAGSRFSQVSDLESASISHLEVPILTQHLKTLLPNAKLVTAPFPTGVIESVCGRTTDAAFLDEFSSSALLLGGLSCVSQPLRMFPVPGLQTQLGVGSTPEAAAVADEIRSGIDISFDQGDLATILRSAGYFSPRNMDYFSAMMEAHRRERWLVAMIGVFAVFLLSTMFAADRIRRQRNRIGAAEGALRDSEHKLRLLANNLSDMVLAYDMDRRLVFASPAVERLTGFSGSELREEGFICWIHADDRARMMALWEKLFTGDSYRDEEYRLITKEGRLKWVMATWGPIYDESGRQIGVQGSEHDITGRKLADESLRESERRFRELLENVQLVAVITDAKSTITFCNDYTLALTGWATEEVMGHAAQQFLDPEFSARLAAPAVATKPQSFFEGAFLAKNGERRWIQWSSTPLLDAEGRAAGFANLGEDVTELRTLRAEATRRESEERFRSLADTAPLMIWVTGPDKGCTFVNKGWLDFTGCTLDHQLGDGWISGVHPDDIQSCRRAYSSAFDGRRSFQVEHRLRRADGEYRWVLCGGVPRFAPDGEFAGYVGNCTDITELKRSRDEDIARQKLESVGRLASGVAHDFNNLLGAVLAQADVALADIAAGDSPGAPLSHIRAVAIRGAGIVRQLMIYSGQDNAVAEPVDVSFLVEDMMELLRVVVSKRAAIAAELAPGLNPVRANPAQLRQVVMNLVTNASEAIGDCEGVIAIRTAAVGMQVALEVSDTGCGIAAEVQAKLFDPFFTTKPAGHGLGLAVVQRIVRGIDGVIAFETEAGRGATFRVLLPSIDERATPVRRVDALPPEHLNRAATLLIVEDEELLRHAVARMLRLKGFSVLEAADGNAALILIRDGRENIDVVLLDITLPGAPSREVFAESRRLRPQTHMILTSAYGQQMLDESFPGMTVDAFIRKPYQLADLIALVRKIVSAGPPATLKVSN